MIDITVITSNSNAYSVKYDLNKNNESATINILQVDQVEPIGLTNYKKIYREFPKKIKSCILKMTEPRLIQVKNINKKLYN